MYNFIGEHLGINMHILWKASSTLLQDSVKWKRSTSW